MSPILILRSQLETTDRVQTVSAACRWFAQCANTPEAQARASNASSCTSGCILSPSYACKICDCLIRGTLQPSRLRRVALMRATKSTYTPPLPTHPLPTHPLLTPPLPLLYFREFSCATKVAFRVRRVRRKPKVADGEAPLAKADRNVRQQPANAIATRRGLQTKRRRAVRNRACAIRRPDDFRGRAYAHYQTSN